MLANRHYMLDAYGCVEEQSDNIMIVNDLLVQIANALNMKPIMPPFLVPYYYCQDVEDVGISAFCICSNGSHITIHTFPKRACYFLDILTDQFFSEAEVTKAIQNQIYANTMNVNVVDRRVFEGVSGNIDTNNDFGPHYMITVKDIEVNFEEVFNWLDRISPRINMQAISRPHVVFDKVTDPEYISGILVVAQSHIAFHYSIKERAANIDIFSCSFLENGAIEDLLHDSFGDETQINLFGRGSKHHIRCEKSSHQTRIRRNEAWRENIFTK